MSRITTGELTIRSLDKGAPVRDWLKAKHAAHHGHAAFVPALNLFEKRRLQPKHNPFFEMGAAAFFVAYRDGKPVGRISAQAHQAGHIGVSPEVGHFGFFDVTEDEAAAHALLTTARGWLKERGATAMRGPFSLSINEECGCQISGFDLPTTYLMPQARPWTGGFAESFGLAKAMDMHAWRLRSDAVSEVMLRRAQHLAGGSAIRARPIRMERFGDEVKLLADIFNDAWSGNWGFVPFSPRAIELLAAELKMIYRASYGYFVEMDGEPIAVLVGVPNINEIIQPFGGRITPVSAFRMGRALWGEGFATSRIPILGIRKRCQGGLTGVIVMSALLRAMFEEAKRRPKEWFEFSWVLETNKPAISALRQIGAEPLQAFRIYEGAL